MKEGGQHGAWAQLERGELTLEQFYEPFAAEVTSLAGPGKEPVTGDVIKEFMDTLTKGLSRTNPDLMEAVARLKKAGLKVAVLTNNWKSEKAERLLFKDIDLFDEVVESCLVGMRKPEETIYQHTLDLLGVQAEEAVFLDDLGHNLKPADKMGIATIQVKDVITALGELQTLVNIDLGVTPGTSGIRKGMEIDESRLQQFFKDNNLLGSCGKTSYLHT